MIDQCVALPYRSKPLNADPVTTAGLYFHESYWLQPRYWKHRLTAGHDHGHEWGCTTKVVFRERGWKSP